MLKALSFNKFADSAHSEEWKQTLKEHEEKKDRVIEKYKGKCEEKKVEKNVYHKETKKKIESVLYEPS